ncbi:hypothetical protein ACFPRL_02680 [Pseudoclavibacter helvolus]
MLGKRSSIAPRRRSSWLCASSGASGRVIAVRLNHTRVLERHHVEARVQERRDSIASREESGQEAEPDPHAARARGAESASPRPRGPQAGQTRDAGEGAHRAGQGT